MRKNTPASYPPRGRSWRRAQKHRAIERAVPVMKRWFNTTDTAEAMERARYWAENLRKCSCEVCQPNGKSRQVLRADSIDPLSHIE